MSLKLGKEALRQRSEIFRLVFNHAKASSVTPIILISSDTRWMNHAGRNDTYQSSSHSSRSRFPRQALGRSELRLCCTLQRYDGDGWIPWIPYLTCTDRLQQWWSRALGLLVSIPEALTGPPVPRRRQKRQNDQSSRLGSPALIDEAKTHKCRD